MIRKLSCVIVLRVDLQRDFTKKKEHVKVENLKFWILILGKRINMGKNKDKKKKGIGMEKTLAKTEKKQQKLLKKELQELGEVS